MKIKCGEIKEKVESAYKDGRDWVDAVSGGTYRIMMNIDDADIWCDQFINEGDYKLYQDDSIVPIICASVPNIMTVEEIAAAYVTAAIQILKGEGWEIEE